jgi:hypothetical protein
MSFASNLSTFFDTGDLVEVYEDDGRFRALRVESWEAAKTLMGPKFPWRRTPIQDDIDFSCTAENGPIYVVRDSHEGLYWLDFQNLDFRNESGKEISLGVFKDASTLYPILQELARSSTASRGEFISSFSGHFNIPDAQTSVIPIHASTEAFLDYGQARRVYDQGGQYCLYCVETEEAARHIAGRKFDWEEFGIYSPIHYNNYSSPTPFYIVVDRYAGDTAVLDFNNSDFNRGVDTQINLKAFANDRQLFKILLEIARGNIAHEGELIQNFETPSPYMMYAAVNKSPYNLMLIENPSEIIIQLAIARSNGEMIYRIDDKFGVAAGKCDQVQQDTRRQLALEYQPGLITKLTPPPSPYLCEGFLSNPDVEILTITAQGISANLRGTTYHFTNPSSGMLTVAQEKLEDDMAYGALQPTRPTSALAARHIIHPAP